MRNRIKYAKLLFWNTMTSTTKERYLIAHVHIFKNAGSTFDSVLEKNFAKGFIDHRYDDAMIKGGSNYLKSLIAENKTLKSISSHHIYFNPKEAESNNVKIIPVYFLRHPIERIKSVYNFEKQQPKEASLGAEMAKELDFEQYVSWRMRDDVGATIRNCHTVFLSGEGPKANKYDEKFLFAKKNIEQTQLIGIVDRYDESMVVFEEYLKHYFPNIDLSYTRKNVTDKNIELSCNEKASRLLSGLSEDLQKLVLEKNDYDLKLYEFANQKLNTNIANISDFENKLNDFKKRCKTRANI